MFQKQLVIPEVRWTRIKIPSPGNGVRGYFVIDS
jgi:hypothetical protein